MAKYDTYKFGNLAQRLPTPWLYGAMVTPGAEDEFPGLAYRAAESEYQNIAFMRHAASAIAPLSFLLTTGTGLGVSVNNGGIFSRYHCYTRTITYKWDAGNGDDPAPKASCEFTFSHVVPSSETTSYSIWRGEYYPGRPWVDEHGESNSSVPFYLFDTFV
jgi:hypothetical protein